MKRRPTIGPGGVFDCFRISIRLHIGVFWAKTIVSFCRLVCRSTYQIPLLFTMISSYSGSHVFNSEAIPLLSIGVVGNLSTESLLIWLLWILLFKQMKDMYTCGSDWN